MGKARARLTLAIAPVGQPIIPGRMFHDAQRERGGVVGGERVCDSRNPAWRCLAGFAVHGVGGVLILLI